MPVHILPRRVENSDGLRCDDLGRSFRPLTSCDFLATVDQFHGINPRLEFTDASGRPIAIHPSDEPIRELVG